MKTLKKCFFFLLWPLLAWGKPLDIILEWTPNPCHIPLYASVKKGFFREEGVEVSIKKCSEQLDVLSLLSGDAPTMAVQHSYLALKAVDRGAQIRYAASLVPAPLSGLLFTQHWNEKGVMGTFGDEFCDLLLRLFLVQRKESDPLPRQLKIIGCDAAALLLFQKIHGMIGSFQSIETRQLKQWKMDSHFVSLLSLGAPAFPELILVQGERLHRSDATYGEKVKRALDKGLRWCVENPEEAFQTYRSLHPEKSEETFAWEELAWNDLFPLYDVNLSLLPFALWLSEQRYLKGEGMELVSALYGE